MSAIQIGDVYGAIYQPDRPIHCNPDGSGQATLTYRCSLHSGAAVVPAYLTPHPFIPALLCYESDTNMEPGNIVVVTSIYKGVIAPNPEQLAQYEFSRTTSEAPIETHPRFAVPFNNPPVTVKEISVIELALANHVDVPPDGLGDAAKLLYAKKRRGIESYLKPGSIFKKSYVSNDVPSGAIMGKIGKIVTPDAPAPAAPAHQGYLLIGVSWTKQAGVVSIHEEYQLSGPGGWDPDLYQRS